MQPDIQAQYTAANCHCVIVAALGQGDGTVGGGCGASYSMNPAYTGATTC